MLNYHADLVLKIDLALVALYIAFSTILILYVILKDRRSEIRTSKLLVIKQNLARLFLSGKKTGEAVAFIGRITPEEFVDVVTNRRKYTVFFNESEQQLFKELFIATGKTKILESQVKTARKKWRRIEAIIALGYIQEESALDILEGQLYGKDEDIAYFSALAIGQLSTMRSVRMLMHFLKERPSMRRKAASILESLSPNITDEVIKFTDDPEPDVRAWAVRLMSKSVSKEYIKKIEALTEDESPEVRAAACESLYKLNDKDSKKILTNRLKDDIWFVRMHAVRALSGIFGKEAIPEIFTLLNDGSLLVLNTIKKAMADNIEAALPYINKILEGKDEPAKKICKEALALSGPGKI